ncbi:AAA family ATPase [Neobacillus sp. YIM B02564]|uniref:AAA family ATPase n=1 Tax=Neobacillus paridis TaxID=2803862 RepID=A0ABS1TM86_9BACI|nr:AAA family ATPase [Neobacillus paridis]MBL4952114.1 AAA family ATPase [Neobacillus paridis]
MSVTFNVSAAFTRGRSEIPGTVFKGNDRSIHCSNRNTRPQRGLSKPMAIISFSMGKGLASLQKNVLAFGKTETSGNERYIMEFERPVGSMVMEYEPSTRTFYHTCSATNGFCYHLFEMIAAIQMAENPSGELANHYNELDFSSIITDEKNFFIACDALYFDAKEYFDGATIEEFDGNEPRTVTMDLTPQLLKKDGVFSTPTSITTPTGAQPVQNTAIPLQMEWNREFTDEEKAMMEKSEQELIGKDLPDHLKPLLKQLPTGDVLTALFIGDAGTSKTTSCRILGRELNAPVYVQNLSLNSEELDLIGGFVPVPGGGFEWKDGVLVQAFRNGGFFVADEINFAKPAVLGVLNNMLDGVGQIVLRSGEVVDRHPNFRFFGCMNVAYVGTQRMNQAFINRFNRVVKFTDMSRDKQIQIVMSESGYKNRAVVEKMVDVAKTIKDKIKEEQIDGASISIRNLVNWATDVKATGNILESSWSTMVWAVCYEDEDVQKEIFEDIINPRFQGVRA